MLTLAAEMLVRRLKLENRDLPLSMFLSEITLASDIHELSFTTPPHGVIIGAGAGVNIARSSAKYAPLRGLVGDHQLASVAQQ